MDGFERRRNEKKEAIAQAAMELFVRYGFEKATVTEIAEKARVSKVSIYNFFESKDNLRRTIVKGMMEESLSQTAEIIGSKAGFVDKIERYLSRRTLYADQRVYGFFLEAIESDGALKECFDDFSASNKQLIIKLIKEGKKAGCLARNVSNEAIEIYIDIFLSYVVHLSKEALNKYSVTPTLADEINRLFLDGLLIKGCHAQLSRTQLS
jgi:AcrR family transcriptional regulator